MKLRIVSPKLLSLSELPENDWEPGALKVLIHLEAKGTPLALMMPYSIELTSAPC
jgi:hypothetical protein